MSPLALDQWLPNMVTNHLNVFSKRSPDKLKTLHLHNYNVYGRKTHQGGDTPQGAPTHEFTLPPNEMAIEGHVTN